MAKIDFLARIESDEPNPEKIKVGDLVCEQQVGPIMKVTKIKDNKADCSFEWAGKKQSKKGISLKLLTRDCPDANKPIGVYTDLQLLQDKAKKDKEKKDENTKTQ